MPSIYNDEIEPKLRNREQETKEDLEPKLRNSEQDTRINVDGDGNGRLEEASNGGDGARRLEDVLDGKEKESFEDEYRRTLEEMRATTKEMFERKNRDNFEIRSPLHLEPLDF